MSVFKGFILWSLSELIVLFRRCRRVKQWEENFASFSQVREPLKKGSSLFIVCHSRQATLLPSENSLRTADAFPVVASLPPKNSYFSVGERRRPEMRLRFAGYLSCHSFKFLWRTVNSRHWSHRYTQVRKFSETKKIPNFKIYYQQYAHCAGLCGWSYYIMNPNICK